MSNMINIGSKESPVIVPEQSLRPHSPEGEEYYQMIAGGSVELSGEDLDTLLDKIKNENN